MEKTTNYLIITVTTIIGGYLPVLFGQSALGGWSILGTAIGGFVGVYAIYQLNR